MFQSFWVYIPKTITLLFNVLFESKVKREVLVDDEIVYCCFFAGTPLCTVLLSTKLFSSRPGINT